MTSRLPDELIEELLNDIETAAEQHAKAKGLVTYMIERRKILKSSLMKVAESMGMKSEFKQANFAYTHPSYSTHITQLQAAIEDEAFKAGKHAVAEARWESWRTLNANVRAASRG